MLATYRGRPARLGTALAARGPVHAWTSRPLHRASEWPSLVGRRLRLNQAGPCPWAGCSGSPSTAQRPPSDDLVAGAAELQVAAHQGDLA